MKNSFAYHHVKLRPEEQLGSHKQPSWELSYVITGKGYRLIEGESSPFAEGDLVLVPPGFEHSWYFNSDDTNEDRFVENITLMFAPELLRQLADIFGSLSHSLHVLDALDNAVIFEDNVKEEIVGRLQTIDKEPELGRIGHVINLIVYISTNLTDAKRFVHRRICNIRQQKIKQTEIFVACNYNRRIGVEDVSRHLGMNKSSFCAFFRRATGTTFMNYLNNYRLEQASYILKTTDEPVNAAAYSCGFQTVAHFNHLFKARYGKTPKSLRHKL